MKANRLDFRDEPQVARFIAENTAIISPPLTPEIILHLAEESVPLWSKTQDDFDQINLPPPYWAFAWAGGQALARYVLDHPEVCRQKAIIDLGAGSGLVAIAAMKAGAKSALAADVDPIAAVACASNAALNGCRLSVTSANLLSGSLPIAGEGVLLIGDLFYERPVAESVMAFAKAAQSAGWQVFAGDPRRSYFPSEHFEEIATYQVPVTRDLEDAEIKRSAVWRLV